MWNPKVRCHVQKSPLLFLIRNQMNSVLTLQPYSRKKNVNIFLPSTPRSSNYVFHSDFSPKILYTFLSPHACARLVVLDLIFLIICGEEYLVLQLLTGERSLVYFEVYKVRSILNFSNVLCEFISHFYFLIFYGVGSSLLSGRDVAFRRA